MIEQLRSAFHIDIPKHEEVLLKIQQYFGKNTSVIFFFFNFLAIEIFVVCCCSVTRIGTSTSNVGRSQLLFKSIF